MGCTQAHKAWEGASPGPFAAGSLAGFPLLTAASERSLLPSLWPSLSPFLTLDTTNDIVFVVFLYLDVKEGLLARLFSPEEHDLFWR